MGEHRVHRRPAAPHVVLIHPVVVDQEVGLQKLECDPRVERRLGRSSIVDRMVRGEEQRWAKPLASAHREIAHRIDQGDDVGTHRFGFGELLLEQRRQAIIDLGSHVRQQVVKSLGRAHRLALGDLLLRASTREGRLRLGGHHC